MYSCVRFIVSRSPSPLGYLQGGTLPGSEQLSLPFGPEAGVRPLVLTPCMVPLEHVRYGLGEGPEGETRCDGFRAVDGLQRVVLPRQPQRQLRKRLYAMLLKELFRHPYELRAAVADGLALVEQPSHLQVVVGARCVVRSCPLLRGHLHHPRREVPHVDELHAASRMVGGEDFAAGGDPTRPVREAVRGIVGARDQTGTNVEYPAGHFLLGRPLAQHLEPPVGLPRDLLALLVRELLYGRLFVGPRRYAVGVDGDARDEGVMVHRVGEHPGGGPHDAGYVAAGIDRRVPAPPPQRREVSFPVAL